MAVVIDRQTIVDIINRSSPSALIALIEQGFVEYSAGNVVLPPVGHLSFDIPPGDVHIKYGYIKGDKYYVIKIASGFYNNSLLGLSNSYGLMLIFLQSSGQLIAILMDQGYLTDLRTAIAGAIAAKYLAKKKIDCIGIVGNGIQAKLQLHYLQFVCPCRRVMHWCRNPDKAVHFVRDNLVKEFEITYAATVRELARQSDLIVTTTSSRNPILFAADLKPGVHITAVGADTTVKQELDPSIFQLADLVIADSREQCLNHGDIRYGIERRNLTMDKVIEMGEIINHSKNGRKHEQEITVADLTGLAIQDIQIAKFIYKSFENQ